jgi:outer membrane immunogenic protein
MGHWDMKITLLTTVSALALATAASAADLHVKAPPAPAPAVMSWTGWYIGIQGGVANHRGTFLDMDGYLAGAFTVPSASGLSFDASDTGGFIGAHAGVNWQSGIIVTGLEADINGIGAKATLSPPRPAQPQSSISWDTPWLATFRGRVGVTVAPMTLLYVTGGLAVAHVKDVAIQNPTVPEFMTVDETKAGWTIGGGIEQMLTKNLTIRGEVRHVDLGDASATCGVHPGGLCFGLYRGQFSNKLLMGLAGATLKF